LSAVGVKSEDHACTSTALSYFSVQKGKLEHDFVVAPGVDPGVIRMAFEGTEALELDGRGNLILRTRGGEVTLNAPVTYHDQRQLKFPPGDN